MNQRYRKLLSLLLTLLMLSAQALRPPLHAHAQEHAHGEEAPLLRGTFQYAGMYNNQKDSVLDYAYSDAYFMGDARVYDPSLSTMSLCLEMSSWSSLDEESWADKTGNTRELLTATGFTDFAQNDFWDDAPTVESIGAVAARKQVGDATLIALAVRGGGYFSEWGSNVLIGAEDEHEGFATARDNVLAFLDDYIARHGITGRVKLWIVGFSRGAAVANMTAGHLNIHGLPGEASLVPADLYCYTFEAPQGILKAAAGEDADHSNIHNVINPNDIVPLVAPSGWDFVRYNQTSHLLPTITTTHYEKAREQMLRHYADVLATVDVLDPARAEYNISEYAKTVEMKINWLSFLPGGNPFVELNVVDNTHLPQSIMLVESVSALVDATRSRDRFHEDIEADISTLLGEMLGAEKGTTLSDYILTLGETLTADNYANLVYVLEPIVQLNLKPFEERMNEVAARLQEVIPQPEGYTDILGTVGALVDVVATMLVEDPQSMLNLVMSLTNTNLIQAHYAETIMAWLRTEDPNFSDEPFTAVVPETLRIVRVNCPVDLMVYNGRGELVASIIGGAASSFIGGIGCAVNPDGEMVLYLPADEDFEVAIIATGDGTVSCAINEFNVVRGRHTYVVNYADVPIVTGDTLTAVIPQLDESEMTDPAACGSNADYRLVDQGGAARTPDNVLRGDQVDLYTVRAERDSEYGQVLGGGSYVRDSFAQLTAYPVSGGTFLGWYEDGKLVSSDTAYRFPVTKDTTVVAHFGEAEGYLVTFTAGEGGSVQNIDKAYPAGSAVLLSASADEGFLFREWRATAGEIFYTEDEERTAWFIVPECPATVTASFVKAGIVCPGCQQTLPEGTHHLHPCGEYMHYTCMPELDPREHLRCTICGDGYICQGGHGMEEGQCGVYVCEGCGALLPNEEYHGAPCGVYGHWACAEGYEEAVHSLCEHCGELQCNGADHIPCDLCGGGYLCQGGHGTDEGQCSYVETYVCAGCGLDTPVTESHAAPCSVGLFTIARDDSATSIHYTCSADYDPAAHAACEHCDSFLCRNGSHDICDICGDGYVCQGGHGYSSGECGVYICDGCGVEILITENHAAPCGTAGHWTCAADYDAALHATCEHCAALLCNGADHGPCTICGDGYVCQGGHGYNSGECGVYVCDGCGAEILITEDHAAPCGTAGHWTCAADYDAALHTTCEHCAALLCNGADHGPCTICSDGYVCQGGHGYNSGECGVYICDGCGAEILITEDHAAPCGTAGHWTCAADYDAALHTTCEHCAALLCNGADHSLCTICGDGYVCQGGHGYNSGECGVYTCDGCGVEILITENHAAPCGTTGHWTCAADYDAALHTACEHCAALLCNGADHGLCTICGDGYVCQGGHGYNSGECGVYTCDGCGAEILITENHAAPCGTAGHWTCAADYDAALHTTCEHCAALLCNGADHGPCTICGDGYVCQGGHGYGSGECGVYVCDGCGAEILITENHAAPCGTAGHWTCAADYDAALHATCEHCGSLLCNGADHGPCTICGDGYVCQGGHGYGSGECGVYVCEGCGAEILITENHAAPCGTAGHWTCAADYDAALHTTCEHCGSLLCNGSDHSPCTICGDGYVCQGGHGYNSGECGVYVCEGCGAEILITEDHAAPCGTAGHWTCAADYDAALHSLCDICGYGNVCEGGHGYDEGQCGYVEPTPSPTPSPTPTPTPIPSINWSNCPECGGWLADDETHLADCGEHYSCEDGFAEAEHALCGICGYGYYCDGTHGYDEGQCGYAPPSISWSTCGSCGGWLADEETHLADCGEHYTCEDGFAEAEHALCGICGYGYYCDGTHGYDEGQCGYAPPSISWSTCGSCGGWLADDETHLADCGEHYSCEDGFAEAEHALCGICGYGYYCDGTHGYDEGQCGYAPPSISWSTCGSCGGWLADDETHLAACGEHYSCEDSFAEAEHALCACGSGYLCEGTHGTGEGQCGIETATLQSSGSKGSPLTRFSLTGVAIAGMSLLRPRRKHA